MKRLFTVLAAVFLTASVFAQSPEKMSYQAVIRNSNDALVTNTQVGMQISILQGSAAGTEVYKETQTPTTNANGLVSIEIGGDNANIISGSFAGIDWANGLYFIKTETDPTGGSSYTITGTSQFLSVPFALYANKAHDTDFNYIITGLLDQTVFTDDSISIPISLLWIAGVRENVHLTTKNVPEGITIEFEDETCLPDFNTVLSIEVGEFVESGTHNFSVLGESENGKIREYTMNLNIFAVECANCELITDDNGEITSGSPILFCGDDLYERRNSSPTTIGSVTSYWDCH